LPQRTLTKNDCIRQRSILVTGGSGFLGTALVKRLLALDAKFIRVVGRSDARAPFTTNKNVEYVQGDLADDGLVRRAIVGIQVVFHLAAMKSIEECERNPWRAIRTNVLASGVLVRAALNEPSVDLFVAASSDKAANPAGVYGMTKALMERLVCEAEAGFGAVRLGSIWGSSGSVIARWSRKRNGTIDLTEPTMTRFFLSRDRAVDLLIRAAQRKLRGQILAHRMKAYVVGDLADAFCRLYGSSIRVVGPRGGEKSHEDLVGASEASYATWDGNDLLISPGRRQSGTTAISSAEAEKLAPAELESLIEEQLGNTQKSTNPTATD
jgi:UDP-N-acetylglucosamine 4,6-dehydratase